MPKVERALVVGSGSIGRRHAKNLRALGVEHIGVVDPDAERAQPLVEELGARAYASLADGLQAETPQVALICSPPSLHVAQARGALEAGAHIFVEKPLAHSLDGLPELIELARTNGAVAAVGYNLRFHPALVRIKALLEEGAIGKVLYARVEVGQYLPDWRPWQDYRQSYTARKELGGGIILDASHEIDYTLWLLGRPTELVCLADRLSDLEVNVEDTGMILMRLESGAAADVHVDFVQRDYSRTCKIVGSEGTIEWSYRVNTVKLYRAEDKTWSELPYSFEGNDMYLAEMESFLSRVRRGETDVRDLEEGKLVVEVALAALRSSDEKRWVSL